MSNPEKLNAIFYLLLNEVWNSKTNPKITFEVICKNVCEVKEDIVLWIMQLLKNLTIKLITKM